MNKKIIYGIAALLSSASIYAATKGFSIDSSVLSFNANAKSGDVTSSFNGDYVLTSTINSEKDELKSKIEDLTKKTTFLLFGDFNLENESAEDYYNRYNEYLKLRYNPEIPKKEGTLSGLDEDSQEYKDDLLSGISVPGIFHVIDEKKIKYDSLGDIRVSYSNDMVIATITIPNAKVRQENKDNPMEYEYTTSNIVMYYYFKQLGSEYKLYYLVGEVTDDLSEYFSKVEANEKKGVYAIAPSYNSNLEDIYDFSKLESITEQDISNMYNNISSNLVSLQAYYSGSIVANANGIIINDGLVITTWDFMEKALINAQFISISNVDGEIYDIEGIVTANPELDVAVIKLKDKVKSTVEIEEAENVNVEDAAITFTSKSGIGLNVLTGIVISKDGFIQSTIPLTETDTGSPLIGANGKIIGMNCNKTTNTRISMSVPSNVLMEVKRKFSGIDYNSITSISFEELKEKYYYVSLSDEIVDNAVSERIWNKYSKIGKLDENIKLKLVKANYVDGIFSVRYQNEIADIIDSMKLTYLYREELEAEGYKNILDSTTKCIYENSKNRVIIMSEMDYLIIVMVKK